jgi:hypothetical protein
MYSTKQVDVTARSRCQGCVPHSHTTVSTLYVMPLPHRWPWSKLQGRLVPPIPHMPLVFLPQGLAQTCTQLKIVSLQGDWPQHALHMSDPHSYVQRCAASDRDACDTCGRKRARVLA